jgi:hypothetical protein
VKSAAKPAASAAPRPTFGSTAITRRTLSAVEDLLA